MSEVRDIPTALKAQRRAAQWLCLTARQDDAGLERLAESIGSELVDWINLAGALAVEAQRLGVEATGSMEAWTEFVDIFAATTFAIEGSATALGALADQVRAREAREQQGKVPPLFRRDETTP